MSAITLEVIDQACESANRSFFPPQINLAAVSTTVIGTILGFPEYIASNPPKRYHSLTWAGTSEQQLFHGADQIGGAKWVYSGTSTIDTHGNYTSLYTKELSEMCTAADAMITSVTTGSGGSQEYTFRGWCGPSGFALCSPCNLPYLDQGNFAIGKGDAATHDISIFWGSRITQFGEGFANFQPVSSTVGACVESGSAALPSLFQPLPANSLLPEGGAFFIAGVVYNHNFSGTLSNEYTEAEALSNGKTYIGNGTSASNMRSGYTISQTSVAFTLNLSRLIPGQNYLVSYQLWDPLTGAVTQVSVPFVAVLTTGTVSGTIPLPARGHTTQIRFPTVAFA